MSIRLSPPMEPRRAALLSPLQLAYIGDTVWDLMVRTELLYEGKNLRHMHGGAIASVNAHAQAEALRLIAPLLSEEENDIAHRGRNAHAKHPVPRNQSPEDYAAATGLEALVGYLYLTGADERLKELYRFIRRETSECQKEKT